nr:retrovirus-related Pol polyprotein from transposon TNT 1-94 [Tanacetum cinerariifolium]
MSRPKFLRKDEGFRGIHSELINLKTSCFLVVVYAPQDLANKSRLWDKIHNMVKCCNSLYIVLGDFNEDNVTNHPPFTSNLFKKLTSLKVTLLDAPFTNVEIEEAVWNCGGEKAPGPDGFTFKFIKFYWDTVGNDFIDMVKHFERNGSIPMGCNSLFISLVPKIHNPLHLNDFRPISLIGCQYKLIAKVLANRLLKVINLIVSEVQTAHIQGRQIIDGPLIVNEILAWATKKKECLFILKVDFEKAFDSFDWSFLDHVMCQMCFSSKWRTWIHGCLYSAYASVIVNGSPTKVFKIQKGLCQGDPLSQFLFIIAMEAFHVTIQEAKANRIFEGIQVGHNNVDVSHLQFADDALIMGKWSLENAKHVSYLEPIIDKFHNRLSSWKGGSSDLNKLAWIAWKKVCSSTKNGGLGIGSLQASNLAMLAKWRWRFHSGLDGNALWKRVIKSTYGICGDLGFSNTSGKHEMAPRLLSGTIFRLVISVSKHCFQGSFHLNPPELRTYDIESLKKDKALTCLHSGIADQIFTSIMDLETPKAVWDKLQETFEGTDRVKAVGLLTLKREFELLRMKDDELVKDYSARMMDVVNQIRLHGEVVKDQKLVEKMMISVPPKFEAEVSAIEESCDLDTLMKVEGAFRVSSRSNKAGDSKQNIFRRGNFSKGNNKGSTSQNSSSKSKKGTFPPCNICQNTNHQKADCWFKDKPNFKCNFCNKFGHLEKCCRVKKACNNTQGVQQANVSEEDQVDDEHLFMVPHLDKHPDSLTWLMDSGCTRHMIPERSFFISLNTKDNPRVKLGDGRYTRAKGRGTIAINTKKGTKYIFRVLYVSELDRSMLSVPQMIKNDYGVNFKNDSRCVITDSRDVKIATLDMKNDSYYLNLDVADASAFSVTEDDSMKCHKRFGHFNYKTLQHMYFTKLVRDMPPIGEVDSKCEGCELGKSHRLPFLKVGVTRATHKLEIVHSDIYGPMSTTSWSGNKYFVLFIDDYTRMCWVYLLSSKASVFSVFKSFKKLVEVKSDSVIHQVRVPYSPQENGVSERKNRMVMEMARSMYEDAFLNETYHDEVDIPEFDIEDTTDIDVLRTIPLVDVYESCNSVIELERYMDASKHSEWIDAMKAELEMIKKNNTWKLVDFPEGKNAIGVKWIYKTKFQPPDGSIYKHKARLVVKGYSQIACIDFGDTFAPVARHDTIKLLIAIVAQRNWKIHHLDVKSAFLNGELEEEVYVKQHEGFEVVGQDEKVYRLYKALYGLKQAPRAWYAKIDAHLLNHNFRKSSSESTLYMNKFNSKERLIISLYVDDLLVIRSNDHLVKEFKKQMESEFVSDMGLVSYFLGMDIKQLPNSVHISQRMYASDMHKKFKMFLCKPVTSPLVYKCKLSKDDGKKLVNPTRFRSIIGSLLYLTISRPDLAFAASFLSRFMDEPSSSRLGAAKRVSRYVKGSLDLQIMFERNKVVKLEGYADSDWAGSIDDSKSTSGYIFTLGSGVFCWNSKKQSVVAQSSAEAEYIRVVGAVNHVIWIRKLLSDLDLTQEGPTMIFCDNKSAIAIAENLVQHGRTKHINVKYHAIREAEKNEEVKLKYCTSETRGYAYKVDYQKEAKLLQGS